MKSDFAHKAKVKDEVLLKKLDLSGKLDNWKIHDII